MRCIALALACLVALVGCRGEPAHITVGVAAALRHATPELAALYHEQTGIAVDVTYGASDTLADQVARGARFDVVVLADGATVDGLIATQHVDAASKRTVATNTIVLVGHRGSPATFSSLPRLAPTAKIAIGDPATVPVGRYARQYLQSLDEWDALQGRLVLGGDVAGVLAFAMQGKAEVAIVYASDARHAAPLTVLDQPEAAPTTSVVAGIGAHSRHADAARRFLDLLETPAGQAILVRHGFSPARR